MKNPRRPDSGSLEGIVIAVDFDGTCVSHEFPLVGREIGAPRVLKRIVAAGARLILWTMRSDVENPSSDHPEITPQGGPYLTEAIQWFEKHEIPLYGIQRNPTQDRWTHSPKAYANIYIDDAALGCPLKIEVLGERPFVDWDKVEEMLFTAR